MVNAYVTVMIAAGATKDVVAAIRELDEVTQADIVAGEFDVIAHVTTDSERDLLRLVTDEIQPLEGVGRTATYIVLE